MTSDLAIFFRRDTVFYPDRVEHDLGGRKETWEKTGKVLGRGAFGIVSLEIESREKKRRAVKSILKSASNQLRFHQELSAIGILSKYPDYFAQFLGWYEDDDQYYLAMEYFEDRDLGRFIAAEALPEEAVKTITRQVLMALELMHRNGITHRDLKPQNIFVLSSRAQDWRVKVGDFGVSKRIRDATVLETKTGTETYAAPEVLALDDDSDSDDEAQNRRDIAYTNAVDLWSLGCTIFELLTRQKPFKKASHVISYAKMPSKFPEAELMRNNASVEAVEFVRTLMRPLASDRPSATAALTLPWLMSQTSPSTSRGAESRTASDIPMQMISSPQSSDMRDASEPTAASHPRSRPSSPLSPMSGVIEIEVVDSSSRSTTTSSVTNTAELSAAASNNLSAEKPSSEPLPSPITKPPASIVESVSPTPPFLTLKSIDKQHQTNQLPSKLSTDHTSSPPLPAQRSVPPKPKTFRSSLDSLFRRDGPSSTKALQSSSSSKTASKSSTAVPRSAPAVSDGAGKGGSTRPLLNQPELVAPKPDRGPLRLMFGIDLETLYKRDDVAVPSVVYECMRAVDLFGLDVVGVYTLTASAAKMNQLKFLFESDPAKADLSKLKNFGQDLKTVQGLLKQFFQELPDPLMTAESYNKFMDAARIEDIIDRRDAIHALINELPDTNYATTRALILHLDRVQNRSEVNKMNAANLSMTFGPLIFGKNLNLECTVLETILQHVLDIFEDDEVAFSK